MSEAAALVAFVFVAWFLRGLFESIRDELADRATSWLLPPTQPATYRIGRGLLHLAARLAPRHAFVHDPESFDIVPYDDETARGGMIWGGVLEEMDWVDPDAALAEFEADLLADARVIDPIRCAAPLVRQAIVFHLANGRAFLQSVRRAGIVLAVLALLAVLLVGLSVADRLVPSRSRRPSRPSSPRSRESTP
jgi:hypothetical protein